MTQVHALGAARAALPAGQGPGRARSREPHLLRRPQLRSPMPPRWATPVEKSGDRPFYFTKSPQALVESGATIPYPPETANCHHEMELVVVIGAPGFRVAPERAHALVYGYACGLDMTRRDLQLAAREKGRPWDLGKDFENAAVVSEIAPMPGVILDRGAIELAVNGERQAEVGPRQADLERARDHRRPVALLPPRARRPDLHRHARRRRPGEARRPARGQDRGRGRDRADDRAGGVADFHAGGAGLRSAGRPASALPGRRRRPSNGLRRAHRAARAIGVTRLHRRGLRRYCHVVWSSARRRGHKSWQDGRVAGVGWLRSRRLAGQRSGVLRQPRRGTSIQRQ